MLRFSIAGWPLRTVILTLLLAPPVAAVAQDAAAVAGQEVQNGVEARADAVPEVLVEAPEPKFAVPTLRDRIGRIWAPVTIDGKGPFRMVLDTGANSSAVTSQLVQSLGASARNGKPIMVHGVTGSAIVPTLRVGEMQFGELLVSSSVLPIVSDVFGGADGILGKEGFTDKRIVIDFGKDRLSIARSHQEPAAPGFKRVPVKIDRGGLLIANISIGSIRAKAIIDTGGQQTVGNLALRNALLHGASRDAKSEGEIIGVTLEHQSGQTVAIAPIDFGDIQIRNMSVMLGDINVFKQWKLTREPALLIGMDVLGSVDTLIIDYRMRELQIRLRGAPRA